MSTAHSVEFLVAINLIVMGASHLFQPGIWVEFFERLSKLGHLGNIFNAMLGLGFGSLILAFHFVWSWPMLLVTIYGVLLTLKSSIYLLFPQIGLKSIGRVNAESKWKFKAIGAVMVILGGALLLYIIRTNNLIN